MRFPVAEISEKLNVDKGNVSAMLKGKKTISDNFFTTFCKAFPSKYSNDEDVGINSVVNEPTESYGTINYLEEAFKLLKEQNEFLRRLIDINLNELSTDVNNNAAAIRAEIRGYAQRQILKEVKGDDEAFLKAKAEADKIYLLNLKQLLKDNNSNVGI